MPPWFPVSSMTYGKSTANQTLPLRSRPLWALHIIPKTAVLLLSFITAQTLPFTMQSARGKIVIRGIKAQFYDKMIGV